MANDSGAKKRLIISKAMTLGDVALQLGVPAGDVILYLLRRGEVFNKNKVLPENTIKELARHYGFDFEIKVDVRAAESTVTAEHADDHVKRAPVVVVIGHVDHGKTSLLDYIRKTRVAQRERGGITQHLGAYKVATAHGNLVFLDTPGHEAFLFMRARGVKIADIAVLVVAADDGIMPQTVEAIRHAREAKVPLVVVINKIDKVEKKRIDEVKAQLSRYDVTVEDWGGDVICLPVSAKTGEGVDTLIETLPVYAELLDLKARVSGPGVGYILEAKMEKGRGVVAAVILQHGVLNVGDYVATGSTVGRINAMVSSMGKQLNVVGPTEPVSLAGFDDLPRAGEVIRVITADEYKTARATGRVRVSEVGAGESRENAINIILRVDTDSSKEALVLAIEKVAKQQKSDINITQAGVGAITESDIEFAASTGSAIYGFCVKPGSQVLLLAKKLHVPVQTFYVIYHLLDDLSARIEKTRKPEVVEKKIGEAIVRKVFNIKGQVIAGCYVKSGRIVRGCKATIWRDGQKIGEGILQTLQREKRVVKEVAAGFECGFVIDGFNNFNEEDRVECTIESVS